MAKIKICGLRRIEDVDYVNCCKVDYAGFVFAKSKRQITKEQAQIFRKSLLPEIQSVGVFVNAPVKFVAELLNEKIIDIAQLHGDETKEYIATLREHMKRGKVIKAIRVSSKESIEKSKQIDVDYLLFDTYSAKEYGGTGKTFDWTLLDNVKKPFFLAGGIDSENVQEAIRRVQPFAIDVSSAVETGGWKDESKIQNIVKKVREIYTF